MKRLLLKLAGTVFTVYPITVVLCYFFPPPEMLYLTYTRGWVPESQLKKDEPIHGMCLPYIPLRD
jgi:hypothetical protein